MKQHKWHKEIKAWADGAEIQHKDMRGENEWTDDECPRWHDRSTIEYRIKPQPKEPQHLLVILLNDGQTILGRSSEIIPLGKGQSVNKIIGKIKLESDDAM